MAVQKIVISMDLTLLKRMDRLVMENRIPDRSYFVQEAVREKVRRIEIGRLADELEKLDPAFEQKLADDSPETSQEWLNG